MKSKNISSIEDIVNRFLKYEGDEQVNIYITEIARANRMFEFHQEIQRQVKDRTKRYYCYLITFTLTKMYSPDALETIKKYVISQMKRPALRIKEAHYVQELTKNGIPHWHFSVKSEKYIAKNRFNYYEKKYGFVDISKSVSNSLDESLNYINKVSPSVKII